MKDQDALRRHDLLHFISFLRIPLALRPDNLLPRDEKQRITTSIAKDFRLICDLGRGYLTHPFTRSLLRRKDNLPANGMADHQPALENLPGNASNVADRHP